MSSSQDGPVVRLAGAWPVGTAEQVTRAVGDDVRVTCDEEARGALPWGDIASLISALSAAITVALSLWDRWKAAPKQPEPSPDLPTLNTALRSAGFFSVEVKRVGPDATDAVTLELSDLTAGHEFRFRTSMTPDGVDVSLLRE